jgi:transcriptional regulator with PAS, ATPase and Fis domain
MIVGARSLLVSRRVDRHSERRPLAIRRRGVFLRTITEPPPTRRQGVNCLLGPSKAMADVRDLIRRAANTDCTVLATGETGTGKDLVARALHEESRRASGPLVSVNCAAVPDTLLESELFGYERGAFSGALTRQDGRWKQAHLGTLFLDEIGDMSPLAQAKVLRAIETREILPLGAAKPIEVNIRIVAATNHDLDSDDALLRRDLFYRLNVLRIVLPALRDRLEDIPVLVTSFIAQLNEKHRTAIEGVTLGALSHLQDYDWPGNVRELRNAIESSYLLRSTGKITVEDLKQVYHFRARAYCTLRSMPVGGLDLRAPSESSRLLLALQSTNWNKSKTAEMLNWSRMTVYRKMAKYQLEGPVREQTQVATAGHP